MRAEELCRPRAGWQRHRRRPCPPLRLAAGRPPRSCLGGNSRKTLAAISAPWSFFTSPAVGFGSPCRLAPSPIASGTSGVFTPGVAIGASMTPSLPYYQAACWPPRPLPPVTVLRRPCAAAILQGDRQPSSLAGRLGPYHCSSSDLAQRWSWDRWVPGPGPAERVLALTRQLLDPEFDVGN